MTAESKLVELVCEPLLLLLGIDELVMVTALLEGVAVSLVEMSDVVAPVG